MNVNIFSNTVKTKTRCTLMILSSHFGDKLNQVGSVLIHFLMREIKCKL